MSWPINHLKCELCQRPSEKDDILCLICAVTFQATIPYSEQRALDARKGQPIFDSAFFRAPDVLPTDNAYYRRWYEGHKDLLGEVRR